MDDNAAVVIALRQHLAVGGQKGLQPAVLNPRLDIDVHKIPAQRLAHRSSQLRQPQSTTGADRQRIRIANEQAVQMTRLGGVDLVEHEDCVFGLDPEFFEHIVDCGDLVAGRRVARVGHVQQQIRLPGFFQRGLEAGDQMMRKIADETDRVA